jgi:hypothetical protein
MAETTLVATHPAKYMKPAIKDSVPCPQFMFDTTGMGSNPFFFILLTFSAITTQGNIHAHRQEQEQHEP